jgi:hypothetical protein
MQRHLDDMTEMCPGAKRPCNTIVPSEDRSRASEQKEVC